MFCDLREAAVQRQLASEKISDTVLATDRFVEYIAPEIINEHGERHGICISDLILGEYAVGLMKALKRINGT
jgi:hypothetical protein